MAGGSVAPSPLFTSPLGLRSTTTFLRADPTTPAPGMCVEGMSDTKNSAEMDENRTLYREAGAEEGGLSPRRGEGDVFGDRERESSDLAPSFPHQI
jgi:hypothetical protein